MYRSQPVMPRHQYNTSFLGNTSPEIMSKCLPLFTSLVQPLYRYPIAFIALSTSQTTLNSEKCSMVAFVCYNGIAKNSKSVKRKLNHCTIRKGNPQWHAIKMLDCTVLIFVLGRHITFPLHRMWGSLPQRTTQQLLDQSSANSLNHFSRFMLACRQFDTSCTSPFPPAGATAPSPEDTCYEIVSCWSAKI